MSIVEFLCNTSIRIIFSVFWFQGPTQVLAFLLGICLEKSGYLIVGAMLQNSVSFSCHFQLLLWLEFLEQMIIGITGKMFLLGAFQVCFLGTSFFFYFYLYSLLLAISPFPFVLLPLFTGIIVASFCYLQFFPAPYDVDGMFLRALFSTFITLAIFAILYDLLATCSI